MLNFSCARRGGPWMAPTRRLGDWPRSTFAVIEIAEAGISIGLQDAGVPGEMLRWVFATAIARIEEHGRRWVRPGKRPVVPDIGPQAAGDRLSLRKHRHRRIVAVHALSSEDIVADQFGERAQHSRGAADMIGQRRDVEIDALPGIAFG